MSKRAATTDDSPASKKQRTTFLPPKGDLADLVPPRSSNPGTLDAIAAARAKIQAKFAAFSPAAPKPHVESDLATRVAEAKRKVEEMKKKSSKHAYALTKPSSSEQGLHPLLAPSNDAAPIASSSKSNRDRYKPMAPKFASLKANLSSAPPPSLQPKKHTPTPAPSGPNPYFDKSLAQSDVYARDRATSKPLKFAQKGKYTRLGDQMRKDQKLDELKKRLSEASRKAGMEAEMEEGGKGILRKQPPPDVEWWDTPYLDAKPYDHVDLPDAVADNEDAMAVVEAIDGLHLDSITIYIQHPIPIPAPGDKVAFQPLKLTQKEMKKKRRHERAEKLRDTQDRIRMGLLPPPPDKVKISNMYRVLTQEAVADPTKVEARVKREMMQRQLGHIRENDKRKLTDEQRRDKLEAKKQKDEQAGVHAAVFKVKYLSDGGHKFKVRKNAEQHSLTGVLLYAPKFALVVVEGGQKAIKAYSRLMLHRIQWTEPSADKSKPVDDPETTKTPPPPSLDAPPAEGELVTPISLADNKCELIWTGQHKDRAFNHFRPKNCEDDMAAKEFLGNKYEGYYDIAKKWDQSLVGI